MGCGPGKIALPPEVWPEQGSAAEGGATRLQREVAHNHIVHCIIVATMCSREGQAAGDPTVRWNWGIQYRSYIYM